MHSWFILEGHFSCHWPWMDKWSPKRPDLSFIYLFIFGGGAVKTRLKLLGSINMPPQFIIHSFFLIKTVHTISVDRSSKSSQKVSSLWWSRNNLSTYSWERISCMKVLHISSIIYFVQILKLAFASRIYVLPSSGLRALALINMSSFRGILGII